MPDAEYFSVLAWQPHSRIRVEDEFVGHADQATARKQVEGLFDLAIEKGVDLLVTPEYSCPWEALLTSIEADKRPEEGRIWVLGMEAATPAQMEAYVGRFEAQGYRIYRELPNVNGGKFYDSVCYLFETRDNADALRKVVLIQFKTNPSADGGMMFERDRMIRGDVVYTLKLPQGPSNTFSTLICSDVLNLPDAVRTTIADHGLILHLQLNPKPRDPVYSLFRSTLYRSAQTAQVFALNWSEKVLSTGTISEPWENESFSAIYWRSVKSEHVEDARFNGNHLHGLYWHYWETCHADVAVLHFQPGAFYFRTAKPDQQLAAPQQVSNPGPEALGHYRWTETQDSWSLTEGALDDGRQGQFGRAPDNDYSCFDGLPPLSVDRLITLSTGSARKPSWYSIRNLHLTRLDAEEVSNRVSFSQDFHERAIRQRDEILSSIGVLARFLNEEDFPQPIADLKGTVGLSYDPNTPWFNLIGRGESPPATIIYIGNNPAAAQLEEIKDDIRQAIQIEGSVRRGDLKRTILVYRDNRGRMQAMPIVPPRFDSVESEQSPSIGKVV